MPVSCVSQQCLHAHISAMSQNAYPSLSAISQDVHPSHRCPKTYILSSMSQNVHPSERCHKTYMPLSDVTKRTSLSEMSQNEHPSLRCPQNYVLLGYVPKRTSLSAMSQNVYIISRPSSLKNFTVIYEESHNDESYWTNLDFVSCTDCVRGRGVLLGNAVSKDHTRDRVI